MLSRMLDSLSRRLSIEEREWRSTNRRRREFNYSWWHRSLLNLGAKPMMSAGGLLLLMTVLSIGIYFIPQIDSLHPGWVVFHYPSDLKPQEALAYLTSLWSVQVTAVGLVYPIVIAFVTLRLQREVNTKASLHMYLHDSVALFAGLSSLFLVAEIGLQFFVVAYVNVETILALTALDVLWFTLNMGLTAFFLIHTFQFIQPSRKNEIIKRYAINICWPTEARSHLATLLFREAVANRTLTGPQYGDKEDGQPSVLPGIPFLKLGTDEVSCNFSEPRILANVHFRVLRLVTNRWMKRAQTTTRNKTKQSNLAGIADSDVICFPVIPFSVPTTAFALCSIQGNVRLNWIERRLIRFAFVFKRTGNTTPEIQIDDIFTELQSEAVSASRDDDADSFIQSAENLEALYGSLIDASQVVDIEGKPSNFTLIPDRNHFAEFPIYRIWGRHFDELMVVASKKISHDTEPIRALLRVPKRLFGNLKDISLIEHRKYFIFLLSLGLARIDDWWAKAVEEQGDLSHDLCSPVLLLPPKRKAHDASVRGFVGTWETLKNDFILRRGRDELTWSDCGTAAQYFRIHLDHTVRLLLRSAMNGNQRSTEWMADVLVKWFSELRFVLSDNSSHFFRKQHLLNIELLELGWDEAKTQIELQSFGTPDDVKPKALLAVCLENYWVDLCSVTLYVATHWGGRCAGDQSLSLLIQGALLGGKSIKAGGPVDGRGRLFSKVDEFLLAILRQYGASDGNSHGYRNGLDNLVERLFESNEPEMVSGRLYSGWGRTDLDSVRDGQIFVLLLLTTDSQWSLRGDILTILSSLANGRHEPLQEFQRLLSDWCTRMGEQSFSAFEVAYEHVRTNLGNGLGFSEAQVKAKEILNLVIEGARTAQNQAVIAGEISQEYLKAIATWASAEGFSKETGDFPLPLFSEVSFVENALESRSLNIKGLEKGQFVAPPMTPRAMNDEDWYKETVQDHVAGSVMQQTIRELSPAPVEASTPQLFWNQFVKLSQESIASGLHPILLIEYSSMPEWFLAWIQPYFDSQQEKPTDLILSKSNRAGIDGYVTTLNRVDVFSAPIASGAALLLASDSLKAVQFSRPRDGNAVVADCVTVKEHPNLVDLTLTWHLKTECIKNPAHWLRYGKTN